MCPTDRVSTPNRCEAARRTPIECGVHPAVPRPRLAPIASHGACTWPKTQDSRAHDSDVDLSQPCDMLHACRIFFLFTTDFGPPDSSPVAPPITSPHSGMPCGAKQRTIRQYDYARTSMNMPVVSCCWHRNVVLVDLNLVSVLVENLQHK